MTASLLAITSALLAYEAATHAGLTQRAATASRIDATLRSWGLADGLFEPMRIPMERLARSEAFALQQRLDRVDPAWGGAADDEGRLRALGWLIAGSVLEEVPALRGRHHFLDPRDGSGLEQSRAGLEWLLGAIAAADGEGSLAGALAGTNFGMRGEPADQWVVSDENDWSVRTFHRRLRRAFLAEDAETRAGDMAQALLAAGALLHVLQDMASPSHVRNDLVRGHLGPREASVFDRSSRYERFVAISMGSSLPAFEDPPRASTLQGYYRGLAERTQNGFFSPGSLPTVVALTRGTSVDEALAMAAGGVRYPVPPLSGLDFRKRSGYVSGSGIHYLATYRIDRRDNLRFGLDERCFAEQARVLLSRAGAASIALLEHLLRPGPALHIEGSTLIVDTARVQVTSGETVTFWEDRSGRRRIIGQHPGGTGYPIVGVPTEAVRVGVLLEGRDANGEPWFAARVLDL